jgi:hypothetical protein
MSWPYFIVDGFKEPQVPSLMIVVAPSLISSSKQMAAPGPPIPCEMTVISASSKVTLNVRYSRFHFISSDLSHKLAII